MPISSLKTIQLLSAFAVAFTAPTWAKALVLVYGAILAPGRRTVTAALRAMGLADDKHFTNYHRVLNRDRWSPWVLSKLLLALIIHLCLPAGAPLILAIDDTLERRRGSKIKYKGWFRDPIRSTVNHVSKSLGIRWICLAVLVPVPWSQRLWALPFMVVLSLSPNVAIAHSEQQSFNDFNFRNFFWQPHARLGEQRFSERLRRLVGHHG
jgi:hypothetical protein